MKIIVSGGSGFVGSNIVERLRKKGIVVTNISREKSGDNVIGWEQFLKKPSAFDFAVFIHLAGKAHDTKNTSKADEYFDINTELTRKVFDIFLKSGASKFIFMSTVKAAADTVDGILTEDVIPAPKTPYGQSKLEAEKYILNNDLPAGKRIFILRPCMIHGPGNKGNLNLLYKFVTKRVAYPLAAFDNKRSFLSIDNLGYVVEQMVISDAIPGGIYNVADDEPLSTNKVVKIIAETSGIKDKLLNINPRLIRTIAKIGDKLHLPLNSERLKKLTESYIVSNVKLKDALHISNLPLSSEEGLRLTIQSFRSD